LGISGKSSLTRRTKATVMPDIRTLTAIRKDDSQMSSSVRITPHPSDGVAMTGPATWSANNHLFAEHHPAQPPDRHEL